jgi:hypothetical protein
MCCVLVVAEQVITVGEDIMDIQVVAEAEVAD